MNPDVFVVLAYAGNDFFGGIKQWRFFRGMGPASGGKYSGTALLESDIAFERNLLGLEIGQVAYTLNNPEDEIMALCVACSAANEIVWLAKKRGIQVVCACIPPPLVGQPGPMAAVRSRVEAQLALPPDAIDLSDRIGDRWVEFLEDQGMHFCDLRPAFRASQEPLYYADDGHINPAGHRLIGEALLPFIEQAVAQGSDGQP